MRQSASKKVAVRTHAINVLSSARCVRNHAKLASEIALTENRSALVSSC